MMKKALFICIMLTTSYGIHAQKSAPKEFRDFILKFQSAVTTHDYDSVMKYMDKQYVDEQYDKLLNKNKKQFIDEFFAGYVNIKKYKGFAGTNLAEIKTIDLYRTKAVSVTEYEIVFRIITARGKTYYCWCMLRKTNNRLGFYGAAG